MHYIWKKLQALPTHFNMVAWAALIVSCAALYTSVRQTTVMTEALTSSDRNRLVEQAMESTIAICDNFQVMADNADGKANVPPPADLAALISKAKQNWGYAAFWLKGDQGRLAILYLLDITSLKGDSEFDAAVSDYFSRGSSGIDKGRALIYRKYSQFCRGKTVEIFAAVMGDPAIKQSIGDIFPVSQ